MNNLLSENFDPLAREFIPLRERSSMAWQWGYPPSVGWWCASRAGWNNSNMWRYWDGCSWSVGVEADDDAVSPPDCARDAMLRDSGLNDIQWKPAQPPWGQS